MSPNFKIGRRLTMLQKLLGISLLFLIPIGIFAQLFIEQSNKDITFAAKEQDGVAYLESVWPVLAAATSDADRLLAELPSHKNAVGTAARRFDADMSAAEASRQLLDALTTAGDATETSAAVAAAAAQLFSKIDDGSNLTLDPDLDSFYTMDAITVKLPEFVLAGAQLVEVARAALPKSALETADTVAIALAESRFKAASAAFDGSATAAISNSVDGSLKRNLDATRAQLLSAATDLARRSETAVTSRAAADKANLEAGLKAFSEAANRMWSSGRTELQRLLDVRISGLRSHLQSKLVIAGGACLIIFALVVFVAMAIAKGIRRLVARMEALAEGDHTSAIPFGDYANEFGTIAKTVGVFRDALVRIERMRAQEDARVKEDERRRRADIAALANDFEAALGGIVGQVAHASSELAQLSNLLTAATRSATESSLRVASASEEASTNVGTVAAATEELSSSITEINRQILQSKAVADRATLDVQQAERTVLTLGDAAASIGDIVELINGIAGQTNLLALNATIEAARAGEAGKGFAIVASEVKMLADQTSKATSRIGEQVGAIQQSTADAASAIHSITASVGEVYQIVGAIAASVEQQGAATREISVNVQHAAHGTVAVSENIGAVSRSMGEASQSADYVLGAAQDLSHHSERLKTELDRFLASVRAG